MRESSCKAENTQKGELMKITIHQLPSKGHDDNEVMIPELCSCGGPILSAYSLGGEFLCSLCYFSRKKKK